MTQRQRLFVFVLAGFFGVAGLAMFGYVFWRTMRGVLNPIPVTEADKRLVVRAADLEQFGATEADPEEESFTALRQFDGGRHIQYEYEPPRSHGKRLYINSTVFIHPESLSAMQTFRMQKTATRTGMKLAGSGLTIADAPQLLPGGGDRYAAIFKRRDRPVGNYFTLREGRVVHSAIIIGLALEEPADVQRLFEPILAESKRRAR